MPTQIPDPEEGWSWTNQVFLISYESNDEDDEHIIRANTPQEAVRMFLLNRVTHFFQCRWEENKPFTAEDIATEWDECFQEIKYVFLLPTEPGITGYVDWHGTGPRDARSIVARLPPPPTTIRLEDE